jgi:ABC-type antimicrobial peptide transport system permease subunit
MPQFDPQLLQVMRNALETVITNVPLEYSTPATKAYLAEIILKAAAQGQTSFDGLVAAATGQIPEIIKFLFP